MNRLAKLENDLDAAFGVKILARQRSDAGLSVTVAAAELKAVAMALRDQLSFEIMIDLAGIDYLHYGRSEWATESATGEGFSRGVDAPSARTLQPEERFGVVYQLLSIEKNVRLTLKVFAPGEPPNVPSVTDVWSSANWFEREAFDMYGIHFSGHPDLRRILTDYGFIGHPFRKDFPVSGEVEVRYDAKQARVVYEPVEIEPRVLVPRVIRDDNRYLDMDETAVESKA